MKRPRGRRVAVRLPAFTFKPKGPVGRRGKIQRRPSGKESRARGR